MYPASDPLQIIVSLTLRVKLIVHSLTGSIIDYFYSYLSFILLKSLSLEIIYL